METKKRLRDLPLRTVLCIWMLLAVMLVYLLPRYPRSIAAQLETNSWPSAEATVTQSRVEGIPMSRPQKLHFEFEFETQEGVPVVANRRSLGFLGDPFFSKRLFASNHPVGSSVKVWYDPQQPTRTTLSKGVSFFDAFVGILMLAFFALASFRAGLEVWRRILRVRPVPN